MISVSTGVLVTLVIFVAGVIFNAGRMSSRLDTVEKSQEKFARDLEGFFRRIEHMTPRRDRADGDDRA